MTSVWSAERQRRGGEACTKVGLALKHVPALDSYPTLRRNPPLSREQVVVFKDFTLCAQRLSGRTFGKGVGVGLEVALVPSGRWHIHSPPCGPLAGAAQCFILSWFGYLYCC